MAEDYQQRKMAKKKRKREGQDERPEGKRVRSKKNKTRRICRGLCYKDPMQSRIKGRPAANGANAFNDEQEDVETAAAPPKPKRRRRNKDQNAVKQSTSIKLLASLQSADAHHPSNPYAGAIGALSPYPKAIQDYMLDQKFTGPTPVQERCVKAFSSMSKDMHAFT